ncbi:MAG TPA: hypothetical protein VH684_18215 [Xanthobacteraceae bacterium]|jgi:hypothetical protein
MLRRTGIGAIIFATALLTAGAARALDDAHRFPDWKGQWIRAPTGIANQPQPPFDPSKPWGPGEEAPLTPQYQAIYDANLAEQAAGGSGLNGASCRSHGMPMMMNVLGPMEIVIEPELTYILPNDVHSYVRRVYTDGRDWPARYEPAFQGLAIGRWIDADGDGRYDTLEIETRGFKGPRVYDDSGIPLHRDNQSIITEWIYLDSANHNILHNEITVLDHGLTRPWSVMKNYRRNANRRPIWNEAECEEGQVHVQIGNEDYYLSAGGMLMPTKKGQAPPDLRYFQQK